MKSEITDWALPVKLRMLFGLAYPLHSIFYNASTQALMHLGDTSVKSLASLSVE